MGPSMCNHHSTICRRGQDTGRRPDDDGIRVSFQSQVSDSYFSQLKKCLMIKSIAAYENRFLEWGLQRYHRRPVDTTNPPQLENSPLHLIEGIPNSPVHYPLMLNQPPPPIPNHTRRIKVSELREDGWYDRGTGLCDNYLELASGRAFRLFVESENHPG